MKCDFSTREVEISTSFFTVLLWLSRELPKPTSDDIEVRICGDEGTDNERTPVELVEVYVL